MPTRGFESFSYTVLEPMACGTPVIATRCGGPTEIITHGVDGLLIPPGRPESLKDALRLLIGNSEIRASLSHSARITVEGKFSTSVVIPQITNWYKDEINKFKNTAYNCAMGCDD
jgi:phosphatidylinositol alpha 1,6-mannosyltransferase